MWENDILEFDGDDQFIIGRIGEQYFNDAKSDGVPVCAAIEGPRGETVALEVFPLLGIDDRVVNDHFAHEEVITVELAAYGIVDDKTKEPHPKAKMALEEWSRLRNAIADADEWHEPIPMDPNEFRAPKPSTPKPEQPTIAIGPTPQSTESIIKKDDGSPLNADLGGFHIFKRPIELLPQMADENGQIKLTVVVQMDEDGKKPKAIVTTDNKGWMHFS